MYDTSTFRPFFPPNYDDDDDDLLSLKNYCRALAPDPCRHVQTSSCIQGHLVSLRRYLPPRGRQCAIKPARRSGYLNVRPMVPREAWLVKTSKQEQNNNMNYE